MTTEKQTAERWLENLLVAEAMVMDLPERALIRNLAGWQTLGMTENGPHHCGSAACFDGWCSVHPYFRSQGISNNGLGFPLIKRLGIAGTKVGEYLFGDCDMFESRLDHEGPGTDKQIVLNRIHNRMKELLS